jgi:hypothetical protein
MVEIQALAQPRHSEAVGEETSTRSSMAQPADRVAVAVAFRAMVALAQLVKDSLVVMALPAQATRVAAAVEQLPLEERRLRMAMEVPAVQASPLQSAVSTKPTPLEAVAVQTQPVVRVAQPVLAPVHRVKHQQPMRLALVVVAVVAMATTPAVLEALALSSFAGRTLLFNLR